jgi:uncharacterized protein (DUF1778 family)
MSPHDKKMIEAAEMNQLNTLSLSDTDWEHFLAIMEAPVRINQNLQNAVKKFCKELDK